MSETEALVFDTEPLLAYLWNENGSDVVEEKLEQVKNGVQGYLSSVTLTEVFYHIANSDNIRSAKNAIQTLKNHGFDIIDSDTTWQRAGLFKHEYSPALGDSYSLATADQVDGTLIVGADDDFDSITGVSIERFRSDPA